MGAQSRLLELHAYVDANACRLASVLQELTSNLKRTETGRDLVARRWSQLYPRHAAQIGNVQSRISHGLKRLQTAGIVHLQGSDIEVINQNTWRYRQVTSRSSTKTAMTSGRYIGPARRQCRSI